jgi:exodeoxyribonuclease V alpha subunit
MVVVENSALTTREWLYTAITRGRELVLLVGGQAALKAAVLRRTQRVTGFVLPCRCDYLSPRLMS